nr:hypothetical protein [Trichocoleus desertorum]
MASPWLTAGGGVQGRSQNFGRGRDCLKIFLVSSKQERSLR